MADVGTVLGEVAGGAVSGPISGIAAIMDAAKGIIGKFVTDPSAKLEASQHLVDLQYQLQMAQLDAETKDVQASAGANNDHYLGSLRAFFGYSMTCLYVWNYAICRFFHQQPVDIPMNLNFIFATLMLGFIGVPAGIEAMKQVLGMPGASTVSVLGVKASNSN
jgi:hypothetical protein